MSLPISVIPSPARTIAPGSRSGGSAEDFAEAVRKAAESDRSPDAEASSQPPAAQQSDTGAGRGPDDQTTVGPLTTVATLGPAEPGAGNLPIGLEPGDALTTADQWTGGGESSMQDAQVFEQRSASHASPLAMSQPTGGAIDAAGAEGESSVRAGTMLGATAPGHAAQVVVDAGVPASVDATHMGTQMPMTAQGSAATAGTAHQPQAGQGQADRGLAAEPIAEMPPRAPASATTASTIEASPSDARALSAAQLADPHGAARTRQSIIGVQGASGAQGGAQGAAESGAMASAPTAASAPLAAPTAAEATSAAGSARPALLPQLTGPVIALTRSPEGQHSITLTVSPDNLGPVTVRAHIVGSSIRLELHSPSDAGRDALRVILADLRRDLSVAAPGASVDVSSRDIASGSSPDAQARPDSGRSETQSRSDAQARGDQQHPTAGAANARNTLSAAPVGQMPTETPTDPSSAHSRIDVYA